MGSKERLTGADSAPQAETTAETTAEPNFLDRLRGNVGVLVFTVIAGGVAAQGCLSEQEQRGIDMEYCQRRTNTEFYNVNDRCGKDTFMLRHAHYCERTLGEERGRGDIRTKLEKICGGELPERQGAQVDFLQKDYRVAKMITCGGEGSPKDCEDKANEKRARLNSLIEEFLEFDIINSNEKLEKALLLLNETISLAYELNNVRLADWATVMKNKLESGQVKDIMKLMAGVTSIM